MWANFFFSSNVQSYLHLQMRQEVMLCTSEKLELKKKSACRKFPHIGNAENALYFRL